MYTAQFRRLGGVTQVTSPAELHSFHNRLTHTLEVAQIARRIAERLIARGEAAPDQLDPDVCEAAALAHDLGHPPFGHNGEKTLDLAARGKDPSCSLPEHDDDGYEGNAQSLRIITRLAVRTPAEPGLNLTSASLRASMKYPWMRAATGKKSIKFGVYSTEEESLFRLFDGLPYGEQTLEAQVMDWADDVAYSVHDLYDFVMAGLIPLSRMADVTVRELKEISNASRSLKGVPDDAYANVVIGLRLLPEPDLGTTSRSSSALVGGLKEWVSTQISRFTDQKIRVGSASGSPCLEKLDGAEQEVEVLKAVTYQYAIGSPALAVRQQGEKAILRGLMRILLEDALHGQRLMSKEAKDRLQREQKAVRTVLDTISGMTDAQATSMYHKLCGISLGSVLDVTTPSVI